MLNRIITALCGVFLAFGAASAVFADDYRICAIRVDFPYEDPDHETTSGRGTFDLRDYYSSKEVRDEYRNPWDVPPHDSKYFANHFSALDTYWRTVSEDRVHISYDIWPREQDAAYTMSKKFYKYGNGRTDEEKFQKLADLFSEAVNACKKAEDNAIDFADYDTFIIIHAGIGSETSGELNDIPSAFLSPDDFDTYLDGPMTVDGTVLDNGIIVPEMVAANGVAGLNGIMAQMFGYRLGLVSLSNNEDGLPAAGGWSLMDTGAMAYGAQTRGFVPTQPCIWSKIRLGWVDPVVVRADTTLQVAATHIDSDLPKGVKIPLSGDEYLLLENRIRYESRENKASATYSDSDSSGVWMTTEHYDAYIPGSGILIWRINERIISENEGDNAVNNDVIRRGVDLLEADGIEDIGAFIGFGDERAEYSEGHDDDTFKSNGKSTLSPRTVPKSSTLLGDWSGVTVKVLSEPGDVMTVAIEYERRMSGFPKETGITNGIATAADFDNDTIDEIITSGHDIVTVYNSAGTELFNTATTARAAVASDGDVSYLVTASADSVYIWSMVEGSFTASNIITLEPADSGIETHICNIAAVGGDTGTSSLAVAYYEISAGVDTATKLAIVSGNRLFSNDADNGIATVDLPEVFRIGGIAAVDGRMSVLSVDGPVYSVDTGTGEVTLSTVTGTKPAGPIMLDADRDGTYETVATTGSRIIVTQTNGDQTIIDHSGTGSGTPVAADIDYDGYPEIVQGNGNRVSAYRQDGIPMTGFPFTLPPGYDDEEITSSPIIADINGDHALDIVVATSRMRMMAFEPDGLTTPGFPITIEGPVSSSPFIFRRTAGDSIAVGWLTDDGILGAYNLRKTAAENLSPWPMYSGGSGQAYALISGDIPSQVKTTGDFEYYCYPNPIHSGVGTFRITPTEATDISIDLYSADGKKVWQNRFDKGRVMPGVPNEITLDATDLASGLYIARIQTQSRTVMYKLGVMK